MKILFLIWAWCSYPSWIPTFRWKWKIDLWENIKFFTHWWWKNDFENWINFFKNLKENWNNKKENQYHYFIKNLEKENEVYIISQNIDHLDYNFKNIIKIHWDLFKNKCSNNYKHFIWDSNLKCNKCWAKIIPNIIHYNESYNKDIIESVNKILKINFDYFILIWSSLEINYVNSIIHKIKKRNQKTIFININPEKIFNDFKNFSNLKELTDEIKFI